VTSANLELVQSLYASWERGDFGSAVWADPEIEYVVADGPTAGTFAGHAGLREAHRDFLIAWKDWNVAADDYRELGDARILVLFRFSALGRSSGLDVARIRTQGASLFELRDGLVTKLVQYLDRETALRELGLGPEIDSTR